MCGRRRIIRPTPCGCGTLWDLRRPALTHSKGRNEWGTRLVFILICRPERRRPGFGRRSRRTPIRVATSSVIILSEGFSPSRRICGSVEREGSWVPHTFAIFECVGDQESSDPRLADAERDGKYLYVDRLPLIPKAGIEWGTGPYLFLICHPQRRRRCSCAARIRSPKGDTIVARRATQS
jgi:hypothetical protein